MDVDYPTRTSTAERFEPLIEALARACRAVYGDRLRALAVFGSVARGTPRPDSDLDLIIVADDLPDGRVARMAEFRAVDALMVQPLTSARQAGIATELSPVIKSPAEVDHGSPLLLDMVEDARILIDRDQSFRAVLDRLTARLAKLGARRIWRGNAWYWDLKPDYRPGEVFEL